MGFYDDEERDRRRHRSREVSQRVGVHRGWAARTYHVNFASVKIGDEKTSVDGTVDYLARDGDFEKKNADLEHVAGDAARVKNGARMVEATAMIRKGPTAERVLIKQTIELPKYLDEAGRAEVAERLVSAWEEKGHGAVAAVHGKGQVQPHVHLAVTARPIVDDHADRDPAKRLLVGKGAVRAERHRIAELINQILDERQVDAPRFHGGRDREMDVPGIEGRAPERRLPQRAWHVRQERDRDPWRVAEIRARAELRRQQAAEAASARKREALERRHAWMSRHDVVPKAHADRMWSLRLEDRAKADQLREVQRNTAKALDYAWDRVLTNVLIEGREAGKTDEESLVGLPPREEFERRMSTEPEYARVVWDEIVRPSDVAGKASPAMRRNTARALDYAWDRVAAAIRAKGAEIGMTREDFDKRMNTDPDFASGIWESVRIVDAARKPQDVSQAPTGPSGASQAPTGPSGASQAPTGPSGASQAPPSSSRPRPRRRDRGIEME